MIRVLGPKTAIFGTPGAPDRKKLEIFGGVFWAPGVPFWIDFGFQAPPGASGGLRRPSGTLGPKNGQNRTKSLENALSRPFGASWAFGGLPRAPFWGGFR